ncbi:MAG: FAD:protein FMN transferase [Oscillospiraceae bacterium]
MKRFLSLLLCLTLSLTLLGCGAKQTKLQKYEASFLELFDTVTSLVGYCETEEIFQAEVQAFHDELEKYHKLYDIYNDYEGVVNIKTINDRAGQGAIKAEPELIDLLIFAKDAYTLSEGSVNVAMGSVLSLWHTAREAGIENPEQAALPERRALEEAAKHTDIEKLIIDSAAGTVELQDPKMRLDVGAVAKGYAVERVCKTLEAEGVDMLLVSVGGNVRAIGSKPEGVAWTVGIQNPEKPEGPFLTKVLAKDLSVVTSGSYQRYYTVEGKKYHHIIDPKTLMPANYVKGVSVLCPNSGLADALSTALFNMSPEAGKALLSKIGGVEAIWVLNDGSQAETPGFSKLVKS